MYQIGELRGVDRIAVLCRGRSLASVKTHHDFEYCYTVGQFDNALKLLYPHLKKKKIIQIVNKSSIKASKKIGQQLGIKDIQCNFDGWKDRTMSGPKRKLYKLVQKNNKWATVHLAPAGIRERRPKDKNGYIGWATTGIFAVDLAAFWKPKEIFILGLDFYSVPYWKREKIDVSWKKNRKRQQEMLYNFYAIVERDPDVLFTIHTYCKSLKRLKNLNVTYEE